MGGVVSTVVKGLVMTVKDMGANMNMGFVQLMQANQQGSAALLTRIQGTDASVAMIGHAVAGLPGTTLRCRNRQRQQSRDTEAVAERLRVELERTQRMDPRTRLRRRFLRRLW